MSSGRVKFYCIINNEKKILFSVEEKKDGALTLFQHDVILENNGHPSKNIHYSVHLTKGGKEVTTTQKVDYADGSKSSHVQYTHSAEKYFLAHLYSCRLSAHIPFIDREREGDQFIEISRYRDDINTMMYAVVVCRNDVDIPKFFNKSSQIVKNFSKFKLVVICTFLAIPSGDILEVIASGTSTPQIDGKPIAKNIRTIKSSTYPMQISEDIEINFNWLRHNRLLELRSEVPPPSENHLIFASMIGNTYYRNPLSFADLKKLANKSQRKFLKKSF